MAVKGTSYQIAHITIVISYTLFCVAVLGVEHPIFRMVASIAAATPIVWAIWVVANAHIPAETMKERLLEEMRNRSTGARYRKFTDVMLAMADSARELDRLAQEREDGNLEPAVAFQQINRVLRTMQRSVERLGDLANG